MNNNFVFKFLKEKNGFYPSKKLGQNFLIDDNYKKKIVDTFFKKALGKNSILIEIGPGLGSLTDYIFSYTEYFILIEFDKRLYEILKKNYKDIEIFNADILKFDFSILLKKFNNIFIISNLPYSISSKVTFYLIEIKQIKKMLLMFQKEFAEKILDTRKLNKLNALINEFFFVKKEFVIPKTAFIPRPKIDSLVISLERKKSKLDYFIFSKFIKMCFAFPRKKLISNLSINLNKDLIFLAFEKLNININERAENLSQKVFVDLFLNLKNEIK